jgi:hypothetical protein
MNSALSGQSKPDILRFTSNGGIDFKGRAYLSKEGDYVVLYHPGLNISGYGATQEEAKDDFMYNLEVHLVQLSEMKPEQRVIELSKYGYKRDSLKHKNFSKSYVDTEGNLKEFFGDSPYEELNIAEKLTA